MLERIGDNGRAWGVFFLQPSPRGPAHRLLQRIDVGGALLGAATEWRVGMKELSRSWTAAPKPIDEHERLRRLLQLGIGEGQHHEFLDSVTTLAASIVKSPISLVSLVEADRQFFLSRFGLDASQTGRDESFCGHCVGNKIPLVVNDAQADPRFQQNPLVLDSPHVRAYLGVPLFAGPAQSAVGTLCVIDHAPRSWTTEQQVSLKHLASLVETYLEGLLYRRSWDDAPLGFVVVDREGRCLRANGGFARMVGRPLQSLTEQLFTSCILPADRQVFQAMLAYATKEQQSPTRRELRFVRLSGEVIKGGTNMAPLLEAEGQTICMIRDISLERRNSARSDVAEQVRRELSEPLTRARDLARAARTQGGTDNAATLEALDALLGDFAGLIEARMGDISGRLRAESDLQASELRLRSLVESVLGPLLVLDDRGRIVDVNSAALHELGWKYEELVGSPMRVVCPRFSEATCKTWFEKAERNVAEDDQGRADSEALFIRQDQSEVRVELRLMTMDWNGPGRLVVIARDVTAAVAREAVLVQERDELEGQVKTGILALSDLRRIEMDLKVSLEEKETLLKEIHHRVKNNLQMVSSLLTLQLDQMRDEHSRDLLADSVRRVRSMALIHQHLYGSLSLERVDLGAYIRNLAETLRMTLAPSARLHFEFDALDLAVERAVPCGLILNELLTNALKYGIEGDLQQRATRPWDVSVGIQVTQRTGRLIVRDRGPGLPAQFQMTAHPSLGLQLVTTLTKQLRGKVAVRNDAGAVFEVEFPLS
jgi:PAS domain S-box-containing protein